MSNQQKKYNGVYAGDRLNRAAFPLGGMGAGMICLEGTGALSHFSICNRPDIFNEPCVFSAICIKGNKNISRVLEGPVPSWKIFGNRGTGNGASGTTFGLPRFSSSSLKARFPFAVVSLDDAKIPLQVRITGWSPFIPADADNSSLPIAALEYHFTNLADRPIEAVYSFNAKNFMSTGSGDQTVLSAPNGFVLYQAGSEEKPWEQGAFCASVDEKNARLNCAWFRGGCFDSLTMAWKDIEEGACYARPPITKGEPSPGGSIYVLLQLVPGEEKIVKLMFSWYVPKTNLRYGKDPASNKNCSSECCCGKEKTDKQKKLSTYKPWYSSKFSDIEAITQYWRDNYESLRQKSLQFSDCFYDTTLPPEVIEAVAANLTILKSPTILRQTDGRLWCWEGCGDEAGCCAGSCTHVWNYAQALPHLFPDLERSLRQTEFNECQDKRGHQNFRAALPIRVSAHDFHAAADGQLGGIMKVYREWRICGDKGWLRALWPKVKASLDYCIETWDPEHKGIIIEPHHNTYDIEFWGPDSMCTSFYLGALKAAIIMGGTLDDEVSLYVSLFEKGRRYFEEELYNGPYFYQKVQYQGLRARSPMETKSLIGDKYSPEAVELFKKEGPKYQYGEGCLSDAVLGIWMSAVCGIDGFLNEEKIKSSLQAIYKYNFKKDLSEHANPQRPSYAVGKEGGLLLCTWPKGNPPSLPFPYSNEVFTGIEYQVASHLMMEGMVEEGLEIVRTCRDRHDGRVRNPFNEYECGHWYARAMASYALLQGLTGVRYDAVEKTLYINPSLKGDFRSFLSTVIGYGTVGLKDGKPFIEVKQGNIDIIHIQYGELLLGKGENF